jgi:restriction endonuclease S subunit
VKTEWIRLPLGEAFDTATGGTPPKSNAAFYGDFMPFVKPPELCDGSVDSAEDGLSEAGSQVARIAPPNSILVSCIGNLGKIGKNSLPVAFNQQINAIFPNEKKAIPEFIFYQVLSSPFRDQLAALASGATVPIVNKSKFNSIDIVLAPILEQKRIIAILDEAFDGIATAKANAEKNLQSARALFQSQLQSIFSRSDASWVHTGKPLCELCELIVDCEHKTAPTQEEGIPSIRTPNIGKGVLLLDGVYRVSEETYRLWTRRAEPLPGDLILAREAPAGNVAVIPENTKVCLGQRTVLIRPDRRVFEPEFLALALLQPTIQQKLLDHSRGATVQHVNMKDIRALDLGPIPPLSVQRGIVSAVAQASQATQRLEAIYQQKLATLDELKKSLLHQAFTGQLTAIKPQLTAPGHGLQSATPQFAANIISFAYAEHAKRQRERTFGRVKEQKVLHLVEAIAKIDLGRHPMKDAAGPNDFQHMLKAEDWAKAQDFFEMVDRGNGYDFKKLKNFDKRLSEARRELGAHLGGIEKVIDLLIPMDSEEAGVFATVHAAWNNLLIDGIAATESAILKEARETWHADKLLIPEHKFKKAIEFIRSKGLIPDGTGKYVTGQKSLL